MISRLSLLSSGIPIIHCCNIHYVSILKIVQQVGQEAYGTFLITNSPGIELTKSRWFLSGNSHFGVGFKPFGKFIMLH